MIRSEEELNAVLAQYKWAYKRAGQVAKLLKTKGQNIKATSPQCDDPEIVFEMTQFRFRQGSSCGGYYPRIEYRDVLVPLSFLFLADDDVLVAWKAQKAKQEHVLKLSKLTQACKDAQRKRTKAEAELQKLQAQLQELNHAEQRQETE